VGDSLVVTEPPQPSGSSARSRRPLTLKQIAAFAARALPKRQKEEPEEEPEARGPEGGGSGGGKAGLTDEPAGGGGGKAEALKTIAGLLAVAVGLTALTIIALVGMGFVKTDNPSVVSIATSSFGVIGTVVGAYFGVKIGTDNTQKAIDGLKDEAAKAQAFATHLNREDAAAAVSTYQALRSSGKDPFGG
jgi:hypothetical protein